VSAQLLPTQLPPTLAEYREQRWARIKPQRERALMDALRTMKKCREEMRNWAMWWRRGSAGETPSTVIRGAVFMRNTAANMARQVRDIQAELERGAS